jgi:hypothetical protein
MARTVEEIAGRGALNDGLRQAERRNPELSDRSPLLQQLPMDIDLSDRRCAPGQVGAELVEQKTLAARLSELGDHREMGDETCDQDGEEDHRPARRTQQRALGRQPCCTTQIDWGTGIHLAEPIERAASPALE